MGFSRQEYWSGLPFPSPRDLPDPGIKLGLPLCRQTLYTLSYQRSPKIIYIQFSSVQSLSCVQLPVTPWTAARQVSLSITNSQSSPKPMSIELVIAGSQHGRPHSWQGDLTSKASGFEGLSGPIPPMTRSCGETWRANQIRTRGTPWTCSSIYPQTRICLSYYFMPLTNSSDINRGLSPTTFFWKKLT